MQTTPLRPSTTNTLTLFSRPVQAQSWRVGQILEAIAVRAADSGRVLVRTGTTRFEANSPVPLKAGDALVLKVMALGEQPRLQILTSPTQQSIWQVALRTQLPRQQGLPVLLAGLERTQQLMQSGELKLPDSVKAMVSEIMRQLPQAKDIAGEKVLQQALRNAGVFLEAKLAQAVNGRIENVSRDLKTILLRLQQTLQRWRPATTAQEKPLQAVNKIFTNEAPVARPQPPLPGGSPQAQAAVKAELPAEAALFREQLLSRVEGVLSRVQLHQLASLPAVEGGRAEWMMELPIRNEQNTNVVQLKIEQETGGGAVQGANSWTVTLAFDVDPWGPMQARVTLRVMPGGDPGGEQVSVQFWAEREHTVDVFQHALPQLQSALEDAGLTPASLSAIKGLPLSDSIPSSIHGLDERA